MAKTQEYFTFRCSYKPDEVWDRLQERVKLLTDRDYLLEQTEAGFDLGIARGGHQGGYWYCASVRGDGNGCCISGHVVHRTWDKKEIRYTWIDKLEGAIFIILLLPLVLVVWVYRLFKPEITDEDRFVEFMTTKMDCELLK